MMGRARVLTIPHQVTYNIIRTVAENGWNRPVYFARTTPRHNRLGLESYLQFEGMASRVVPIRHNQARGRVVPAILKERLDAFRLTGLDRPDIYYDARTRGTLNAHYRPVFAYAASSLHRLGHTTTSRRLLDRIRREMPFDIIPGTPYSFIELSSAHLVCDEPQEAAEILSTAQPIVLHELSTADNRRSLNRMLQLARTMHTLIEQTGNAELDRRFDQDLSRTLNGLPDRLWNDRRNPLNQSG